MKLKLDAQGHAVVVEGKPVYVMDDGKEVAFDAPATVATISRLNGEAKGHRERAEKAEGDLKKFEGIDDPEAARSAIKTVSNLNDKKLVDAGEVEKVKLAAIESVEKKYKPVVEERDKLQSSLHKEMIGGRFSRSKFITDKLVVPADMVEALFGKAFKIEGDKVTAYNGGNKVFSRSRPGEDADFDEALEILVDNYANKGAILKGKTGAGGGSSGNNGGSGKPTKTRSEFDKLNPMEQGEFVKTGVVTEG